MERSQSIPALSPHCVLAGCQFHHTAQCKAQIVLDLKDLGRMRLADLETLVEDMLRFAQ